MQNVYIDPDIILGEVSSSYKELWDSDLSYWENWLSIANQACWLPERNIQMPVALAVAMANAKWCRTLPILFSCGSAGTGKSTFATIAAASRETRLWTANDTFASLRNDLSMLRFLDPPINSQYRDGPLLAWDNLGPETLKDPKLYQLLLLGYSKKTEVMSIAGGEQGNLTFHTFSSKIFSSIHPFHLLDEFSELARRLIVIFHSKIDDDDFNPLPIESYSWEGAYDEYCAYWGDFNLARKTGENRNKILRIPFKSLPESFSRQRWEISVDIINTLISYNAIATPKEGIELLDKYWTYFDRNKTKNSTPQSKLIADFIDPIIDSIAEENAVKATINLPGLIEGVPSRQVMDFLKRKSELGELDFAMTPREVSSRLQSYGYKQQECSGKLYWVKR